MLWIMSAVSIIYCGHKGVFFFAQIVGDGNKWFCSPISFNVLLQLLATKYMDFWMQLFLEEILAVFLGFSSPDLIFENLVGSCMFI